MGYGTKCYGGGMDQKSMMYGWLYYRLSKPPLFYDIKVTISSSRA